MNGSEARVERARRWLVKGLVQGVGFRWFVWRRAERLGLRGYCRNVPNGDVEVLAIGPQDALAQLAQDLRRGPPGAHVERLEEVNAVREVERYNSFEIN